MPHYLTWMADVLRDAGLSVREIDGWRTRGHGAMNDSIAGIICHHTAGPAKGLFPSEKVVVQGRTGLPGPLCNLGLDRAGTWIVVAAGQAWHAGSGSAPWCPAGQGNSRCLGVEAESVGVRDDWTPQQRESYPRGVAALLRHLDLPAERAIGHKEWAPGRKIDPAFWDMNVFRRDVARWMTSTAHAPKDEPMTPEDRAYFDKRFADLWGRFGVRPIDPANPAAGYRDRLTDLWDALQHVNGRVDALQPGQSATGPGMSDADVGRVAAAVVKLLGEKASAP